MSEESEGIPEGFGGKLGKIRFEEKGRQGFGRIHVEFEGIQDNSIGIDSPHPLPSP